MQDFRTCPRCAQWVALPDAGESSAAWECPHCGHVANLVAFADSFPPALRPADPSLRCHSAEETPQADAMRRSESGGAGCAADGPGESARASMDESSFPAVVPLPASVTTLPGLRTESSENPRREGGGVREFIKIVAGGAGGLVIGYWLLLWLTGNDFLDVSRYLPRWMLPSSVQGGQR